MYKGFLVDKSLVGKDIHFEESCSSCHKGDEKGATRKIAHRGLVAKPSENLETCEKCHEDITKLFRTSLHYTTEGQRHGVADRFSQNELKVFNEKVFEKSCRSCHASCGDCHVKAPIETSLKNIKVRVRKRFRWITKQINCFKQFEPKTPRRYAGGETHIFLGRQYRLKIIKDKEDGVKLKGAYFFVTTADPHDRQKIKNLLDTWYKYHARLIFTRRLEICLRAAKRLSIPSPNIKMRKLRKRWGSCGSFGDIILNTDLVKTPLYCIDYVIMHELCHKKIPYHNKKFYQLLAKYMPDWEKRKRRLEMAII